MARKTLRQDWADVASGRYQLVNNVWNKGDLVNGEDYTQSISYGTKSLTDNVTFKWNWPDVGQIVSYPEIIVGYKPWDEAGSRAFMARIEDIQTFKVAVDYDISGQVSKFNVAFDLWLTDRKAGSAEDITTELMIWTHDGGLTPAGEKVGIYRHGTFKAEIWVAEDFGDSSGVSDVTWRYIAFRATREMNDGTIDINRILANLAKRDLIDDRDYVNGYEFGAEVSGGRGMLALHHIGQQFAVENPGVSDHAPAAAAHDHFDF